MLIAGFITRRVMIPKAMHYVTYRAPENPQSPTADAPPPAGTTPNAQSAGQDAAPTGADSEHLTAGDRDQLNAIIKRKAK
ncbi:MAG TPA: hypothetical protein VEU51_16655 [Candidatus Acidoferrales bacterium]|nr:hypothetical protein [Candidatus Acidoferrales bacterium]